MAKTIWKKTKFGTLRVPHIKIDCKDTLMKTVVLVQRQTHREQLNRVQKLTHPYNHLIYMNLN